MTLESILSPTLEWDPTDTVVFPYQGAHRDDSIRGASRNEWRRWFEREFGVTHTPRHNADHRDEVAA